MSENLNRRKLLQVGGTGIGITGWYVATGSENAAAQSSDSDLVVVNNGRRRYRVQIRIRNSTDNTSPVYSRTLNVGGFNDPDGRPEDFKFRGKIAATGRNRYDVTVSVTDGGKLVDEGSTRVTLTPDGIASGTQLKVYVGLDGDVEAFVGG